MILHVVAVLLFSKTHHILVQLRPAGSDYVDYWEFPGGKIEQGEDEVAALKRELLEELGLSECNIGKKVGQSSCDQGDKHVKMTLYSAELTGEAPTALHAKRLKWMSADELYTLPMPPVDIALLDDIRDFIKGKGL